jgi:hypothetical protein
MILGYIVIPFAFLFLVLLLFKLSDKFNCGITVWLDKLDDYIESLADKIYKRFKK